MNRDHLVQYAAFLMNIRHDLPAAQSVYRRLMDLDAQSTQMTTTFPSADPSQ